MSRLLVEIRGDRRQEEAAALAGITQIRVSRAERGQGAPFTPDEAEAYARALGVDDEQIIVRLVELAEARAAAHITSRQVLVRSAASIQARIRDLEAGSTLLRSWAPDGPPGALQTGSWTQAMLDGEGVSDPGGDWWAARRARVALLDEPDRTWHVIVAESGLRWAVGSRQVAADQIEHLAALSARPNVRVGVIDQTSPKPMVMPRGFHLYDDRVAEVATVVGTAFPDEPGDLAYFAELFGRLDALAVYDDAAREVLERIARSVRRGR